jgi:hypothetical protein
MTARRTNSTLIWSLADFRRWWGTPARRRWHRVIRFLAGRDLTNFGDIR